MKLLDENKFLDNIKELCDGDLSKPSNWTGKGIEMILTKHLKELPKKRKIRKLESLTGTIELNREEQGYNQCLKDCEDK